MSQIYNGKTGFSQFVKMKLSLKNMFIRIQNEYSTQSKAIIRGLPRDNPTHSSAPIPKSTHHWHRGLTVPQKTPLPAPDSLNQWWKGPTSNATVGITAPTSDFQVATCLPNMRGRRCNIARGVWLNGATSWPGYCDPFDVFDWPRCSHQIP